MYRQKFSDLTVNYETRSYLYKQAHNTSLTVHISQHTIPFKQLFKEKVKNYIATVFQLNFNEDDLIFMSF